jgi:hypothetical protein
MPAAGIQPNRLELWVFQAFMTCLMGRGRGLMLHAAGVEVGGNGYLFAGHSNDGKSTLAGLWKGRGQVLNDDRVIVRRRENRFLLYGTPWHGDYGEVSYGGVPLRKVFFLNKAGHTGIQPVQGAEACAALIARSFAPLWDEEAMRFTLDFCARMISEIPCFELSFTPNESVIDFLVTLMRRGAS